MKSSELKGLSPEELEERLEQSVKALYNYRVGTATKELEDTSNIRKERRNIARIKQAIAERKRAGSTGAEA